MAKKSRPKDMTDIESLLEKNTDIYYLDKWHPTPVSHYEKALSTDAFKGFGKETRKNIAYSIQYLEFIQKELDELHLHNIIEMQLMKTYIIAAMGIIEAIFLHLVRKSGFYKKEEWIQERSIHTNVFNDNGTDKKHIITTSARLKKPVEGEMDFEFLINKIQDKKLIDLSHKAFPHLKALKRIRNKVHLQIAKNGFETDYYSISKNDYLMMRYLLCIILKNKKLGTQNSTCLSFSNISTEQITQLKNYLKEKSDKT